MTKTTRVTRATFILAAHPTEVVVAAATANEGLFDDSGEGSDGAVYRYITADRFS